MKEIQGSIFTDEERAINQKIDPAVARYYELWDKAIAASSGVKNKHAYRVFASGTAILAEVTTAIGDETEYNRRNGSNYSAEAAATGARVKWLTWLVLLVSVILRQRRVVPGCPQPDGSAASDQPGN